jgi:hypothetical protein
MDREFSTMRSFTGHAWRITLRTLQIVAASTAALLSFGVAWMRLRGRGDALPRAAAALVRLCTPRRDLHRVGQIASTRADLCPGHSSSWRRCRIAYRRSVRDRASHDRGELGAPLGVYSQFDAEPVAAASVARVHRAVLRAGRRGRRQGAAAGHRQGAARRSILLVIARALERVVPSLRLVSLELAVRAFCDAVGRSISPRRRRTTRVSARTSAAIPTSPFRISIPPPAPTPF